MKIANTDNTTFNANIKLTPKTRKWVLDLSVENQRRFINAQNKLGELESSDELLLSRKMTKERKVIPVLTNLRTGAMIAQLSSPISKVSTASINLIEAAASQKDTFARKIFSKNQTVIDNSIVRNLSYTIELSAHPLPYQKLKHIELDNDSQSLLKELEKIFPKKEICFKLSKNEKLFIKQFDEGYIYYICDNKNMPDGRYFTATYYKDGFRLNYNDQTLSKEKVEKYYNRYTQKALEN